MSLMSLRRLASLLVLAMLGSLGIVLIPVTAHAVQLEVRTVTYTALNPGDCHPGTKLKFQPPTLQLVELDTAGNRIGPVAINVAEAKIHPDGYPLWNGYRLGRGTTLAEFDEVLDIPYGSTPSISVDYAASYLNGDTEIPLEFVIGDGARLLCYGEPTDSDGDGVPDYRDQCINLPGSSDTGGCPGVATLNVVTVKPVLQDNYNFDEARHTTLGSVTYTVTNQPSPDGASLSYSVSKDGEPVAQTLPVPDGATSEQLTFETDEGSFNVCLSYEAYGPTFACQVVEVTRSPQLAHQGSVEYVSNAEVLQGTVTNTGWKETYYGFSGMADGPYFVSRLLQPNESFTFSRPAGWGVTMVAHAMQTSVLTDRSFDVGSMATYAPPPESHLAGGTEIVRWIKPTPRRATLRAIIRTTANQTSWGYQWRRGSQINWERTIRPGRHAVSFFPVKPGQRRCVKVYAKYWINRTVGGDEAVTGWKCFRRPRR